MNNKFFHSVYLDEEKCTGCITCLKRCPTQAIRVRNKKASIIREFCIDCGECVRHCPHHAKQIRRDSFDEIRKSYRYLVALPAPSLYSQFNNVQNTDIILTALKLSGFDDVFEVSAGAEIISELSREYINSHPEQHPLISTACPTIERLIRVRFPSLIGHLLPLLPPMEAAARMARRRAMRRTGLASADIGIVFLSPCPSKITFINDPLGITKSNVDTALAIQDIYPLLLSQMKKAQAHPESCTLSGRIGKGWAISGGESNGIVSDHYLAADGIENVIRVLEDLEDGKFLPGLHFVELNACSAGCVGGVLTVENPYIAKAKVKQSSKYEPVVRMHCADLPNQPADSFAWDTTVDYEPVYTLGANIFESMEKIMESQELLKMLPRLDCGSCGSPTCKALAEDIVKGVDGADLEDCIFLMRRKVQKQNSTEQ